MHHGIHHFHGTPVWGSAGDVHRIAVSGAGAFVSYVRPDQIAASIQHAQVVGIDNGAFSAWVRGLKINWSDFYKWLLNYYHHPKVAFFVIPDVVDGGERDNDALIDDAEWTITTLTHTVSPDNGFTTSLELEVRIDDFEME